MCTAGERRAIDYYLDLPTFTLSPLPALRQHATCGDARYGQVCEHTWPSAASPRVPATHRLSPCAVHVALCGSRASSGSHRPSRRLLAPLNYSLVGASLLYVCVCLSVCRRLPFRTLPRGSASVRGFTPYGALFTNYKLQITDLKLFIKHVLVPIARFVSAHASGKGMRWLHIGKFMSSSLCDAT